MKQYDLKCSIADFKGVVSLVIQTRSPFASADLMKSDTYSLTPTLVQTENDDVLFILYEKGGGLENGFFLERVSRASAKFMEKVKRKETWLLILQLTSINEEDGQLGQICGITMKNMGGSVQIGEAQWREGWLITL